MAPRDWRPATSIALAAGLLSRAWGVRASLFWMVPLDCTVPVNASRQCFCTSNCYSNDGSAASLASFPWSPPVYPPVLTAVSHGICATLSLPCISDAAGALSFVGLANITGGLP